MTRALILDSGFWLLDSLNPGFWILAFVPYLQADVRHDSLTIEPITRPFTATITPPGSKSLTNRALVLAALAEGTCELSNVLFADDTLVMLECLGRLGFDWTIDRDCGPSASTGGGGNDRRRTGRAVLRQQRDDDPVPHGAVHARATATTRLDGIPRMRQRPIGELVDLLKNLGVRIEYADGAGLPAGAGRGADGLAGRDRAVRRRASRASISRRSCRSRRMRGTRCSVDLDGPADELALRRDDDAADGRSSASRRELIRDPRTGEPRQIIVPHGHATRPTDYAIEPDASNATYFLAAAAIHPGSKVTIEGLGKRSLQGDVGFADVLHRMGADLVFGSDFITVSGTETLEGIDVDLSTMPDTAQTLAVAALFAEGPTTIRGLHTLRVKETDRVAALATELTKLGAEVSVEGDDLTIQPPEDGRIRPAAIDTYDDHRMAMSFALAGTKSAGVRIKDPECVNKTYPEYFRDLEKLRG